MQTKSNIQHIVEKVKFLEKFEDELNSLQEKYIVENSIFTMGNELMEVVKGYFVVDKEFDNLHEAIKSMINKGNAIRITENKYAIGNIYKTLSECPENSKIYDIVKATTV